MSDLRTLAENATPPPWFLDGSSGEYALTAWPDPLVETVITEHLENLEFIAQMRNGLDGLLGELDGLRAIVNDLAAGLPSVFAGNRQNVCGLCAHVGLRPDAIQHAEWCPYRRAVEYKEGQP